MSRLHDMKIHVYACSRWAEDDADVILSWYVWTRGTCARNYHANLTPKYYADCSKVEQS